MRTFTAALAVASLLVGSAAAMAQATRALQANPFERQGTTPAAASTNPLPQPAPRTASSQPGATPAGANQFQSGGAAKQACGADTVVWVNTSGSKAWHVSGDKYYGHTKRGAYMCGQAGSGSAGPASIARSGCKRYRRSSPTQAASLLCTSRHECWVAP